MATGGCGTTRPGLPVYLFNSTGAALLTIVFCLALTIPAGYALARFPVPGKEVLFVFLLLSLIIPYQALINPIFFMFAKLQLTNSLVGLAILHTAIQMPFSRLCHAQQLRGRAARARRGSSHRRLQQLAGAGAHLLAGDPCRPSSQSRCSPSSPRGTSYSARS